MCVNFTDASGLQCPMPLFLGVRCTLLSREVAASFASWTGSHSWRVTRYSWGSVGPEARRVGLALVPVPICKVLSLVLHAGAQPWNLLLFLAQSVLEGLRSLLFRAVGLQGPCPYHPSPIAA